tara:strand:+ start:902 stop:1138 length:237 start_codon:yes stop_codon:yes gene_type:complete
MFGLSAFAETPLSSLSGVLNNRVQYANNGAYSYIGINSTSRLFIGDWELEFNPSDTWVDESNTTSTWIDEIPPSTTWN